MDTSTARKGAMSIATFCERFDLCKASVHKLIKDKKPGSVKAGRRRLIPVEAAEAWWQALQKAKGITSLAPEPPREYTQPTAQEIPSGSALSEVQWLSTDYPSNSSASSGGYVVALQPQRLVDLHLHRLGRSISRSFAPLGHHLHGSLGLYGQFSISSWPFRLGLCGERVAFERLALPSLCFFSS